MTSFSAEAMVEATMSTRISELLLSVRNYHASVKMTTEPIFFTVAVVRGEAIIGHIPKKFVLSTPGRLDRLSSNRIQTLLWGFSARPSLLLSISNCSVLLVLESKF